jgi:acetolactate synthase-1/2/3 large subunit
MKVSDFFVEVIRGIGITEGFSLVGGMSMHLNRSAGESLSIYYCNHEQAVVAAADGYAKASEYMCPGLAIVTSGPGVTNTITSIASAYFDSVPLVLLAGQVKSTDLNIYGVRSYAAQEVPHQALLAPVTKASFTYHPDKVSNFTLASKLALAMTGRKGPVHIDLPLDVQAMNVKKDEDVMEVLSTYRRILEDDKSQTIVLPEELIANLKVAKRPLLVLGNALKIASISKVDVSNLIDHMGFPVLFTWASMDLIDYQHPMAFGCAGGLAGIHSNRIIQNADLILFLGTRLDLLTTGFNIESYGKYAKRFVFDCDTAELEKYSKVENLVGIKSDIRALIRSLKLMVPSKFCVRTDWISQCQSWQTENQQFEDFEFSEEKLNTFHVSSLIASSEITNYVVPTASGYAIEGFARFYKTTRGSRFAWAGHVLGSMGLALPSAIGASVRLKKCVACVDGDGGFLLNMQELYTLRANPQVPIAIFILNNLGYLSISQSQNRAFQRNFGANPNSGLSEIDFEVLASLGYLSYVECKTYISLKEAIAGLNSNSRILINIILDEDTYRGPSITTKFDTQGLPYSSDIGDVSWR